MYIYTLLAELSALHFILFIGGEIIDTSDHYISIVSVNLVEFPRIFTQVPEHAIQLQTIK